MTVHSRKNFATPRRLIGADAVARSGGVLRLGKILCDNGVLSQRDLVRALGLQARQDVRLGVILRVNGMVSEQDLVEALSIQSGFGVADLDAAPPDADLLADFNPVLGLKHGFIPLSRTPAGEVLIALANPAEVVDVAAVIPASLGPPTYAVAPQSMIERHIGMLFAADLTVRAETKCPGHHSCRSWARPVALPVMMAVGGAVVAFADMLPVLAMWILFGWVFMNLVLMGGLRSVALSQQAQKWRAAWGARWRARHPVADAATVAPTVAVNSEAALPTVTVLVPLFHEDAILPKLVARLGAITYPKELLDICLVLEEGDDQTHAALAKADLPLWMRAVTAPKSPLKTKPRAMNYALDFCHGEIIGIYDAEDAPEPDQITRIVRKFHESGPEVACVQAYLDYYNPQENWLSRCFTIEYATWFRIVLQAVEHLHLPVPLGGTSVFFRREILEHLGGWDAHNVTEDADLGMRLAREGYRCAFEPSTTFEEANCRAVPWVKQRSRWLKGYAMTWITHMRHPRALWRDLGPRGFLTFQMILLGTLSSFLLAPAIWLFWLIGFGYTPSFYFLLPRSAWYVLGIAFVATEVLQITLGVIATSGKNHRSLIPWVPTMMLYWPLGTIAAYKAIYEVITRPFYWDKTRHGVSVANAMEKAPPETE